jgi:hypothetical protein
MESANAYIRTHVSLNTSGVAFCCVLAFALLIQFGRRIFHPFCMVHNKQSKAFLQLGKNLTWCFYCRRAPREMKSAGDSEERCEKGKSEEKLIINARFNARMFFENETILRGF